VVYTAESIVISDTWPSWPLIVYLFKGILCKQVDPPHSFTE
jgi:hypothetical protein